jgi:hypothetical protein
MSIVILAITCVLTLAHHNFWKSLSEMSGFAVSGSILDLFASIILTLAAQVSATKLRPPWPHFFHNPSQSLLRAKDLRKENGDVGTCPLRTQLTDPIEGPIVSAPRAVHGI